jgi:hypothetical protein
MAKFDTEEDVLREYNDKARERMLRWRRVFATDEGRDVLIELLSELHCLSTDAPTVEVIIRENVGKWILAELGIFQPGQERALVDAYLGIDPTPSSVPVSSTDK